MAPHGGHREARRADFPPGSDPRFRAVGQATAAQAAPGGAAQAWSIGSRSEWRPSPALTVLRDDVARRFCATSLRDAFSLFVRSPRSLAYRSPYRSDAGGRSSAPCRAAFLATAPAIPASARWRTAPERCPLG